MSQQSNRERCLILVKALPHASSKYQETVCCAGISPDTEDVNGPWSWRRQYPVPYRRLRDDQSFKRWDWVEYRYRQRKNDDRRESRVIEPETLTVAGKLPLKERARYVNRLIRQGTADADERGESLCLVRPRSLSFSSKSRTQEELRKEREKHIALASQLTFFDDTPPPPLEPCPYVFHFEFETPDGKTQRHQCEDWETSTAFFRRRSALGSDEAAIESLKRTYLEEYPSQGMLFAMGTHSWRGVWLLVGVLRVDQETQSDLFLPSNQ